MSTLEALSQMARDHKSSLGVTDPANGQLIGNLSVSDLRWVLEWRFLRGRVLTCSKNLHVRIGMCACKSEGVTTQEVCVWGG